MSGITSHDDVSSQTGLNFVMNDLKKQLEETANRFIRVQNELNDMSRNVPQNLQDEEERQNRSEEFESEDFDKEPSTTDLPPPGIPQRTRRPQAIPSTRRAELLSHPPGSLRSVFENYLVSELALNNWLRKRPVLISDNQTIERALSRINAHEVHSLPVVDSNKDVIGLIDVLDITAAITSSLKDKPIQNKVRNDFMMKTVGALFLQKHTKSFCISNRVSLWVAAEQLVHTQQQRFLIVDREGEVSIQTQPEPHVDGLLTASDILRFLTQNVLLMRHEPIFMKKLKDLGLGTRAPKIVNMNDIAGEVFTEMGESGISGVAVVDAQGKLHSNLSASDLKGLTRKNVNILNSTVENYILRDRKRGWWVRPIVVNSDETLISVVLQFVCAKCHRMYLVDEDSKPVGEINHYDILKELIKLK